MRQPLIPFDVPLEDEDDIEWQYFQHYRDMGPERTKVALTEIEIGGKTRDKGLITRWAKKFQWDFRAHAYDMATMQKAQEEIILTREEDLAAYIERDIDIARDMQEIVNLLVKGIKDGVRDGIPINPQDCRAIIWVYRESRMWVKDNIAFTYGDGRKPTHHD